MQCARERNGRPDNRPDRGRAGAVEKGPRPCVPADAVEAVAAEEDEGERGREGDKRGEERAADAARRVADDGDRLDGGTRGDLTEGDRVQELRRRHPVVVADRIGLHERDDDEAAAVGERAHLERDPDEREQAACGCGSEERKERCSAAALDEQLDRTADEEHEDDPRTDERGRRSAGDGVGDPSEPAGRGDARPAARHERSPGAHGHRSDCRSCSRSRAEHPTGRRRSEEHGREADDEREPRDDERCLADEAAEPSAQAPRAVDRELRGGGARK